MTDEATGADGDELGRVEMSESCVCVVGGVSVCRVCVCVYTVVCVYLCVSIGMCLYRCVGVCVYECVSLCVCVSVCVCVCVCGDSGAHPAEGRREDVSVCWIRLGRRSISSSPSSKYIFLKPVGRPCRAALRYLMAALAFH